MKIIIKPKPITKENFSKYGDVITTKDIKPLEINNGYAKRFDGIANLDTSTNNGETTICIFSALKRSFPMKIDITLFSNLNRQVRYQMNYQVHKMCQCYFEENIDDNIGVNCESVIPTCLQCKGGSKHNLKRRESNTRILLKT